MRLELRHLQVICSIADYGSLTKAASALGLAPSALTTQLQRIERSLGGPLFERDRRGARPTPLGDLVLSRARTLLPAVRDLHDEAIRLAGTARADSSAQFYRIGAVSSPILGGIIRRLNAADLSVQVQYPVDVRTDARHVGRRDRSATHGLQLVPERVLRVPVGDG